MKKYIIIILTIITMIGLQFSAFSWGRRGHTIVAEIAFSMMDSATKSIVRHYTGGMTLEESGNWMDDMRSDRKYDFMKTWHYVDFEKGTQYEPTKDGNAVNALNTAISELEHKENMKNEDIRKELLMIFHLVGDIHQPLHVGYGSDKGGNSIQVKYLADETNLHRVWDTEIIESENITKQDCLAHLKDFDKEMIDNLKVINIENWIHEPRSLLNKVYDFKDSTIDRAYVDKNKTVIEQQLLIAGIRLSAILNHLFKA